MNDDQNTGEAPTHWGLWPTLGFSLIVIIAYLFLQIFLAGIFIAVQMYGNPGSDIDSLAFALESNGLFISIALITTGLLCGALILLFAWIRKGITLKQYFYLSSQPLKVLLFWLGITVLLAIVWDGLAFLFDEPVVHEFMTDTYETADIYPLFWFAIIIAAPFLEELFFRGFLFDGLRTSRMGSTGAIIITSLLWAIIHLQYDMLEIGYIFFMGLILGVARIKTRSLYIPFAMHVLNNFLATIEVAQA